MLNILVDSTDIDIPTINQEMSKTTNLLWFFIIGLLGFGLTPKNWTLYCVKFRR